MSASAKKGEVVNVESSDTEQSSPSDTDMAQPSAQPAITTYQDEEPQHVTSATQDSAEVDALQGLADIVRELIDADQAQWAKKKVAEVNLMLPLHHWSNLPVSFPLARLLIKSVGLSKQWSGSVKGILLDFILQGVRGQDLCARTAQRAWDYLLTVTNERAALVCQLFGDIPADHPLLTSSYPWKFLQNRQFWQYQYVHAFLRTHDKGYHELGANAEATVVSILLGGSKKNIKGISMPLEEVIIYFPAKLVPDVAKACERLCSANNDKADTLPRLARNKQDIYSLRAFAGRTQAEQYQRPRMTQTRALFASGIMDTDLASLFVPHWIHTDIKIETRMPHPDTDEVPPFWGVTTPDQMQRSCSILQDVEPGPRDEQNFLDTFQIYNEKTVKDNLPDIISVRAARAPGQFF